MEKEFCMLLVEDDRYSYLALRAELEASSWDIARAEDGEDALSRLPEEGPLPYQVIAIDLGLPPGRDNPFRGGLPLAEKVRARYPAVPILAYTALTPKSFDYSRVIARLLALRASFIYKRRLGENVTFVDLLNLVRKGYVLISPNPAAEFVPDIVPLKPDPLNKTQWQVLQLINENKTYHQIDVAIDGLSVHGVRDNVARIRQQLIDAGELTKVQTDLADLRSWYRRNRVRYCRD